MRWFVSRSFAALQVAAALVAQQSPVPGWMRPPAIIERLVEAPPPPDASLSPQHQWLVLTTREPLPGLDVLARPHLKLAGLRVDPETWGPQLSTRVMAMQLRSMPGGEAHAVAVAAGHWSGPYWSADDRAFALVRRTAGGGELWLADPATAAPHQVEGVRINTVLGAGVQWLRDQRRLLVNECPDGAMPVRPLVPDGPQVQSTIAGEKATVRTYQDLLQDSCDEALFGYFATSQLAIVDSRDNSVHRVGAPAMFARVEPSPDGTLWLVERIERPFSYVVPSYGFPRTILIVDPSGNEVRVVDRAPLHDAVPIGGVPTGPRAVDWLASLPHTLVWSEALDGGDPRRTVPQRDQVMRLTEPAAEPVVWFRTEYRHAAMLPGADGFLVLATEVDHRTRKERVWRYDAKDPARAGVLLYERSTQDAYGDPGRPIFDRTVDGRDVLRMSGGQLFLAGNGASPQGERPFVDRWQVASAEPAALAAGNTKQRLFEAAPGHYETFVGFLDDHGEQLLVRSESPTEPPSLVVVDRAQQTRRTLCTFADPAAEATRGVEKRLLRYEREDGVPLSGTLYLPPGHAPGEKLPCLVWAYPLEYTDKGDAGQVRAAPDRYLRLAGASHLFLLLHGYAVFDDAAMPIVGPQRTANDSFLEQVRMNARAAVKALTDTGVIDGKRIAVAGHSYGAFMTANLLAHTDLFACGIARSGAYNRTLTPFGFQNEERTYWEAPDVYNAMSPFMHADQIHAPLLLIHGDDDNNPGTFPIQSQRLFAAIKGHGGTARLCMLPHEAHGYRARENVLQCLAEMCSWLDTYMPAKTAAGR